MVKYQIPTDPEASCCPICLDNLVCARITKCGHFYCLACLLRHIQVHAQSNPYAHVKCPCCAVPLHIPDLRPVLFQIALPPKLHQRMKLVKLHRTKDCPSPYIPRPEAFKRSSSHAAPCATDLDSLYCRFNYVDPIVHQEHLVTNKVELEMELANLAKQRQQIQRMHPRYQKFHSNQAEVEGIFLSSSLEVVRKEVQKAIGELDPERELAESYLSYGSGVCQQQPPHLIASNYEITVLPQQAHQIAAVGSDINFLQPSASFGDHSTDVGSSAALERHRGESMGSEGDISARRYRGDSIGSCASTDGQNSQATESCDGAETEVPPSPNQKNKHNQRNNGKRNNNNKPRKKQEFPAASMYLDCEGSTHFYQSEDGQLCFLSGFNMNCLSSDFSAKLPDEEAIQSKKALNFWQRRRLLPFPDSVEGEIIEIESINLTPEIRKRMPFLGHLPLYTDIRFIELDLNNLMSAEAKKKFKVDLEKRRKRRQNKVKAEKKEDKMAQRKEEERIFHLKTRLHQVDPNDEFFQFSPPPEESLDLTSEAFGPAIAGHPSGGVRATPALAAAAPSFSFSNVTQSMGAFPALAATNSETNFPSLGSLAPPRNAPPSAAPTWGAPSRSNTPATVAPASGPRLAEASKKLPAPSSKKKSKGKKISLFSTGGQRGMS